jgi:hypothetical protein
MRNRARARFERAHAQEERMLKKVIFAAALAIGFMASFRTGNASFGSGVEKERAACTGWGCDGQRCDPILGCD